MIGIYKDEFKTFLEENLGKVKVTSKNLITKCPYCETDKSKKHYHMYISLEAPMFHCFYAKCNASGTISKLLKKIQGIDESEKFIDLEKLKESKEKQIVLSSTKKLTRDILLPELREDFFSNKRLYLKKRLKFQNIELKSIKGLVFDIHEFIEVNKIVLEEKMARIRGLLQSNFIGFLTENKSVLICRNIDSNSVIKHVKIKVQESNYLDYYKIPGQKFNSTNVIVSEGVYDIWNESIFDTTGLKKDSAFYACALSANYSALLDSIVFNEDIYKLDAVILSDRDVPLEQYKKLKYYKSYILNSLTIFYNRVGKDFADTPCVPEKFIL